MIAPPSWLNHTVRRLLLRQPDTDPADSASFPSNIIQVQPQALVELGHVTGAYGLQGWLKVYSATQPRENIVSYGTLLLKQQDDWRAWKVNAGRRHGHGVVLKLKGCNDRTQAEKLIGAQIAIKRDQLPKLHEAGDYYWADLVGLQVENTAGESLGVIDHLFETGANDVLVVQGDQEYLIPYVWRQVVKKVDLSAKRMLVDWDKDY